MNLQKRMMGLCILLMTNLTFASGGLYVDPVNGKDSNNGKTTENAFRTIEKTRNYIRSAKLNKKMKANLHIYLRKGRYQLNKTLSFDARDSGDNGFRIIYKAYKGEEAIICGGRKITNWKKVDGKPYYVAKVPQQKQIKRKTPVYQGRPDALNPRFYDLQKYSPDGFAPYFAQLYVNGVRAVRAKSSFINSSRKKWWNNPETVEFRDGIYVNKADIKKYTNPEDLRILWLRLFKTLDAPVQTIIDSDNKNEMIIKMRQPDFNTGSSWHRIRPKSEFFIINALEELDEPGEWYLDQKKDLVYYYPFKRDGDLNLADVYAPRVETLLRIDGSPMEGVKSISIDGLTFQNGNWAGAKDCYLGISQAEIFKTYTSELPGQIVLDYADNIIITRCIVRNMGSCGIQLYEGCDNTLIEGNIFYDTTGAGISIGRWWHDKRECPPASICTNIKIFNNVVRNTGRDYWQGTGINIFAAYDCKVYHNDVSDIAYTALHARIGDSPYIHSRIGKLEYKYNKVSRAFSGHKWGIGDGGQYYMHGRYPNSIISENYSLYANKNINMEYYPDNDSYKALWTKNVSRYSKSKRAFFVKGNVNVTGNFSDNKVSKGVKNHTFIKNDKWPKEAKAIMANAGLQPKWRYLLNKIYGHENIAYKKHCWASSYNEKETASNKAVDGDWHTFWETKTTGDGKSWWAVDLGNTYVIQKITILPRQDKYSEYAQQNIEIQASNNKDFKDYVVLAEQNEVPWCHKKESHSSNLWEQFLNIPVGYRYLRVKAYNKKGLLNFAEFAAYGYLVNKTQINTNKKE